MADAPKPAGPEGPYDALSKEACERRDGCKKQKTEFDLDIREGYFFAAPHRAREIRSDQPPNETKPLDAGELQTGIASELARDFVTAVVDAFMPQSVPWAERRPGMFLPDAVKAQAQKEIAKQDPVIFDAIRASNLYEEVPKAWSPDLAIGTSAMWIDDLRPAENIVVQAVPLRELEINIGPTGEIDDRFIVRHTKNRYVEALLPGVTIPAEIAKKIKEKPDERTMVAWGFWRLWDRKDDLVWQHVILIEKEVVAARTLIGPGSCPLIVMRFNPCPEWAFGVGPLIEALPDLRQLDSLEGDKTDHSELSLRPPVTYPNDSFAAVENGIEPGSAYPIRPGDEDAVKPIFEGGDANPAMYETAVIEERLRRRFFLNFPQQRGKTPPTATQWIDELQEAQRRLGTPGMPFWKEGPAQIFLRFQWILQKNGHISPIEVNGKVVSLEPYNPAQRAAEQQEVAMAIRFMQIGAGAFPEEFKIAVDGDETLKAIASKMRVNGDKDGGGLIKFRNQNGRAQALAAIAQLTMGRQRTDVPDPAVAGGQ